MDRRSGRRAVATGSRAHAHAAWYDRAGNMTKARPPRKHHYIPEFYQRPWSGTDGCVERYTRVRTGIHRRREPPSAVGYQRDLYRYPSDDINEWAAQQLEWGILSKIDNAAAVALEALLASRAALQDMYVRRDWTLFLRTMLMRTPTQMQAALDTLEAIYRRPSESLQARYEKLRQDGDPASVDEFLLDINPDAPQQTAFRIFAESLGSDRVSHHIMSLPWRVFDCRNADHRFLLSDHPVAIVPLQTDLGQIAMPLSPTKMLVIAGNNGVKAQADAMRPKAAVRALNGLTVRRACHYVVAPDRLQEAFISKHFGVEPVKPYLASSAAEIDGIPFDDS